MGRVKKWLAELLALVLVLAGVPMYAGMEANAKGYNSYDYELCPDGENIRIVGVASDIDGDVKIPSKIDGMNVVKIGDSAFSNCKNLTGIEIPDSVTSIGNGAFWGCSSLTSIKIPDSVTNIGIQVFSGCSSLASIEFPNSVESIGYQAFNECSSLASMKIPDSVKAIGSEAFLNCSNLESIEILGDLENIGKNAFKGCNNLAFIEIPNNVVSVGNGAFEETKWLENKRNENSLVIEKHILIDGSGCSGSVNIPNGVTSIADGAFKDCSNLERVEIPDGMENIGESAFEGCSKLAYIGIPDSVMKIGQKAFGGTEWLENRQKENPLVIVNHILIDGDAYASDGAVEIPASVKHIGDGAFYNDVSLKSVIIPDGMVDIGDYAFYGCELANIIIPRGVTSIGDYAFEECAELTTIEIPDSVEKIGKYAFHNSGLTSVEISCSIDDGAFYNCSGLTRVVMKNGVENIGEDAFSDCENLAGIAIPSSVTQIGQKSFYNCSNLTDVEIPSSVVSIGECAFLNCSGLKSATISCSIEEGAFEDCGNLAYVTMKEGVKSIGRWAFYGCKSLENVTISSGAVNIEEDAFRYCSSLANIEIPETVVHFGGYTFMEPTITGSGSGTVFGSDSVFTDCGDNLTICGYSGSEAEIYASKHGIKFKSLGNAEDHPKLEPGTVLNIRQEIGEKKFLISCNEPGNYILRYENPENKDARVKFAITEYRRNEGGSQIQSTCMIYIKPFQGFTGSKMEDNEANVTFEVKEGGYYEVTIEAVEKETVLGNYQLRCEKQPAVRSIQVDNDAYKVMAGGDNWWGLSGYAFLVTYTDGSIQHLFGPRGYHPETYETDPYLPYDDYGNFFRFALKDENQKTDFYNLVAGEYPVTITVSDEQVFEDVLKIWDTIGGEDSGEDVSKVNINQATITLSKDNYIYDGQAKTPSVTVKLNGKTLKMDTDYMVIYSNNINIGTAKVIIVGKGNYTGNKSVDFTIVKAAEKTDSSITCKKTVYKVAYGAKPFKINATSKSALSFTSSNPKIAAVDKNTGNVTIKGTGIAAITIKAEKNSVKVTVKVSPKKQSLKSLKAAKGRKLTIKWAKDKNSTGYQVQISANKNFKKSVKQKNVAKNSYIFTKLKAGKKYYVRVRSYKKSGKETLYGAWSNVKQSGKVKK